MTLNSKIEKVAALGPAPTFSSLAAHGLCKDILIDETFSSIRDVVEAVGRGEALLGVVPTNNSIVGEISDTQTALSDNPEISIILRRNFPINLALISQTGVSKQSIRKVVSKKQALDQCDDWLKSNIPEAQRIQSPSTSMGIEQILADRTAAMVAAPELADDPRLQIVAAQIQDIPDNQTEFAVIALPTVFGIPEPWDSET